MSSSRRLGFILAYGLAVAATARPDLTAAETSPTAAPPAIYKEKLERLLTPLDEVLKNKVAYSRLEGDGVVLLDETVTYVQEDGKRISVYHSVDLATNDAGVRAMAQGTFTYKKKVQHAFLVLGQTIQPDGTKDAVKDDAVFLKTPQDQADDAIYDDDVSLVTVYSNVKPGSITENITVLVDDEPRIPGQYSQTYTWNGSWAEYLQRLVVDLPKSLADRLKVTNLGQSVPTPKLATPDPARQQMTWEKLNTPADNDDGSEAPSSQIGPIVWLSTLPSWDAFAGWFYDQLKGTDQVSPELKAKIDLWTKDAKTPGEILRILYGHVARDVRYTGFELGKSDLQPHDCMSVWQRQYGDCKDKSNLLRALLAAKGIDSWLTLLDADHAGAVNKANPDYRQFDHCIVNVKIGDQTIFCDPTIAFAAPGVLNGNDADRDVLVIKPGKGDWEHTPPFHDAALDYSFDLKLRPNGELAGWVELIATGYYSAAYEKKFRDLTKDQIRSSIEQDVQDFFPNSSVADVEPLKEAAPAGELPGDGIAPFTLRAYMTLTGVLNQGDGASQIKFPAPNLLLPGISGYKSRQHATFTWPDYNEVSARIELPPGWHPGALPSPFVYDSPSANFQAAWSAGATTLTADCKATIKHSLLPPDEWRTFGDAATNLFSWCSKSIEISRSNGGEPATPPLKTDAQLAADLPVMPTGEGELNLIDSEFPTDGNLVARRAALERIPGLFPSDQKATVEAAIRTAALDLHDEKWAAVIDRLKPLEDANRAVLDPDTLGWADYVVASALLGEKKKDEAGALYRKIAENSDVDSGRRGWAVFQTASLLSEQSPAAALDFADTGLGLDSGVTPQLYAFYASTAIRNKLGDRLKERLTRLISTKPENLEDILLRVTDSARDLIESGHKEDGLALLALLDSLSDPATTGEALAKAIKKVRDGAESVTIDAKLQEGIKALVAAYPEIAALEKKQPKFSSAGDVEKSISQHEDAGESPDALGCAVRLAIGYPVDERFPDYFWDCMREADWNRRNSSQPMFDTFFFKLAELGDGLPHSSEGYADTKLLQAKTLGFKGQHAEAAAIFDAMVKQTDLAEGYQGALTLWSGENWEQAGDYVKALACYQPAEKTVDTDSKARESVLRSAFIQFDNGNTTEAMRLVKLLADSARKGKIKTGEQLGDVIVLANDPANPPAFWNNWHTWWPQWQQIETFAGMEPLTGRKVIPIIPSLVDLGSEIGSAKNAKDTKRFFEIFREMAYASRFYPNALDQFVGIFSYGEEVLPDHANDFRKLAITMLEPLTPTEPAAQRSRVLNLIVNYVDTSQNQKALELMAHDWKPELEDASPATGAIHRVWAIAAVHEHQDLDKAASALESDLKNPTASSRAMTVGVLADVYVALGRKPDAAKLLQTELANPAIATASQQDLKTRLDNIQNASQLSQQLANGVSAWLEDHQPSWWNYAEPKTADDPRLARLEEILKNPRSEFEPAEWVKAGLLAPSVASLGPEVQEEAVLRAFTTLLEPIGSQDDANALAHSVIDSPAFPPGFKADFLYEFLIDAYEKHQAPAFQAFARLPLYQTLNEREKPILDRLGIALAVDRTSAPALTAAIQAVSLHPLDWVDIWVINDAVTDLLQMGDIDAAQGIYQAAANDSFAPDARKTKPEFQLALLKEISYARRLRPIVDALRQTVLARQKPETIEKPEAFDQRRNLLSFADLPESDARKFRLYMIKTSQGLDNFGFWFDFMRDQDPDAGAYEFKLSLLKAGLASAVEDDDRATLVSFGAAVLDIDKPDLRQKFLDLTQPYRDAAKFPRTAENLRLYDLRVALRTGKPVNLDADLVGFTGTYNSQEVVRLKLVALAQSGDPARLKTALEALSAEEMVSPSLLPDTLPALEAAGMKDEADLSRDTLVRELHNDMLSVWFSGDGNKLRALCGAMKGLGSTQDVPADFTTYVVAHVARQRPVLFYRLFKAYLEKDWPAAANLGEKYTQAYPDEYIAYWMLGRSLAELGRKGDAARALAVYCQYSKDEIWYPDAKALLAKLGGASS